MRERDVLTELRRALVAANVNAVLVPGASEVPDQLFVDLEPDAQNRVLQMQLLFLPGMEPSVLQLYVGLPYALGDTAYEGLCRFLAAANVAMPVGHFGLAEASSLLYYRYNSASGGTDFDFDGTIWAMASAAYMLGRAGPLIERVAGGADWSAAARDLAELIATDTATADALD